MSHFYFLSPIPLLTDFPGGSRGGWETLSFNSAGGG